MLLIFTIFLDDVRKKMYGQIKKNKTIIDFIPKKNQNIKFSERLSLSVLYYLKFK